MAPVKREKIEPEGESAFERRRRQNMLDNKPLLDAVDAAAKVLEPSIKIAVAKTAAPRKKANRVEKVKAPPRPTRTSSRIAGKPVEKIEGVKLEAYDYPVEKPDRTRKTDAIKLEDIGLFTKPELHTRTFTQDDIKETTDEELKAVREELSDLTRYEKFGGQNIRITPNRVYAMAFHPTKEKSLVFAGDKGGHLGIFDASQPAPEDNGDDDEEMDMDVKLTQINAHTRTISSILASQDGKDIYTSSYDSSIRKLDLQKEICIEAFGPSNIEEDLPISCIDLADSDQNMMHFSTLDGRFGRHDLRTKNNTDLWQLHDKKIGGFSLHPLQPHLVATTSLDRTLKIWDLRNIKGKGEDRIPALMGEHDSVLSVSHAAWSAGGHIATSSYDDTIKIHSFKDASSYKIGYDLDDAAMKPNSVIKHNNKTGQWVTILKPRWQKAPSDGIEKFVVGNMSRFVDIFNADGVQLAQLGGDLKGVPAVAAMHPTRNCVAGGDNYGRVLLWQDFE